ncbi:MAG: hypothetical protein ACREJU_12490 [Nitrospiraceae bacterium]
MLGPAHGANYVLLSGLIFVAAVLCLLQLYLPIGIAVGMLYIVPVLISLWVPNRRYTAAAALAGTALTILGFFISEPASALDPDTVFWIGLLNRALTLFLIWTTTFVVLLYKRAGEQIKTLEGLIPICASCKKIRDEQGNWNVLEMYIQNHSAASFTHGTCPECLEQIYRQMPIKPE